MPCHSTILTAARRVTYAALVASLLPLACSLRAQSSAPPAPETHGIAITNMDPAVKPGDNFYLYANGAWVNRTQIPADRAGYGVFTLLSDLSTKRTNQIIEDAAKSNPSAGTNARKIADLFNTYMDQTRIESLGLAPLQPHLKEIAAIRDRRELALALGKSLRVDVDMLNNTHLTTPNLFGLWIAPGFSDSDHYVPYMLQGGLALPNESYYLQDTDAMKKIRERYTEHVTTLLRLASFEHPDTRAQAVINLETAIAKTHLSIAEIEDIQKANNPWSRADFTRKAPGLDWTAFFEGAGLSHQQQFIVWTPTAITAEAKLVASTPIDVWKDWLAYHLIDQYSGVLPAAFADEQFNFYGKTLSGVQQQRPRWQRGVAVVNAYLGDAVGQIYAEKYFPPQAKAEAQAMVANIIAAFHKRLDALTWLAPTTRAEAHAKLDTLYVGIGYPEKWIDYSAYDVRSGDAFGNAWRASTFDTQRWIARLGTPVDRHEWCMTPQTVNAVNMPLQNALNFPAAILQPPFFDPAAPAAFNYGAIGSVIGHEISHTFDAEGSAFDDKGRVRNWWTPEDHAHFDAEARALEQQFDGYEVFPGLHVNGKQTIDENIADLGGIAAAYDGYRASLKGAEAPLQDGFTGDQQFYIAFAQNWATKIREAALRSEVVLDPHAPGEFRALTVRNADAWYKAFNVQPGDKLYLAPDQRVRIW
jgi:putative endopeptidase